MGTSSRGKSRSLYEYEIIIIFWAHYIIHWNSYFFLCYCYCCCCCLCLKSSLLTQFLFLSLWLYFGWLAGCWLFVLSLCGWAFNGTLSSCSDDYKWFLIRSSAAWILMSSDAGGLETVKQSFLFSELWKSSNLLLFLFLLLLFFCFSEENSNGDIVSTLKKDMKWKKDNKEIPEIDTLSCYRIALWTKNVKTRRIVIGSMRGWIHFSEKGGWKNVNNWGIWKSGQIILKIEKLWNFKMSNFFVCRLQTFFFKSGNKCFS